ncbi:type II toxin-antitoxin system RelE/ParE family toxin [Micromonospora parva]|uniref:type II toxin-antitoxin system RelE/ParE family toxin n=1 Tax=Micromonospora parva TaxID=1464048 RepID=UPI003649D16E
MDRSLQRRFGVERAKKIRLRLSQMTAASSIAELRKLPGARCHQLEGDRDEQFSVDLDGPYRLIFEVDVDPTPRRGDGGIDVEAVDAVIVIEIVDTH